MTAEEEIAALNAALPKKYNSAEEEIAALNAELRGESAAHGVELANKKDELGFWERKRLELEEKTGKKTSWGDLALNKTIGFGIDEAAEANDEWREIQLMNGKIDDPGSIWSEARNMGISADDLATALEPAYIGKESFKDFIKAIKDMEETPAGLSDGPSNFSIIQHKFKGSVDPAVMKTRFADIAKSRLADRIKTREAAQSRLHGAEAQSGWGMFFSGLADMPSMLSKFFHPAAIVLSTGVDAHNRSTRLATDTYTLDAKGNPQIAKEYATDQDGNVLLDADGNPVVKRELRGETDDVALSKGAVGAITESLIWTKLGALAKPLRGLMLKIPGVDRLAAKLVKGSASAGEKLVNKLGQSSSGRLAMKTVAVLGDVEEKTHLGSLPSMIAKSRLTEFCDEVVGLNARPGEREAFGEWLNKVTSAGNNADMLLGLLGMHAASIGFSAAKAHGANKRFRHGVKGKEGAPNREGFVAQYIGREAAKKLSNKDLDVMNKILGSGRITPDNVNALLNKIAADRAEAKARMESGQTLAEVMKAWRDSRSVSQGLQEGVERLAEMTKRRAKPGADQEHFLDETIKEFVGEDLDAQRKVKERVLANLTDARELDDPQLREAHVMLAAKDVESGRDGHVEDASTARSVGEEPQVAAAKPLELFKQLDEGKLPVEDVAVGGVEPLAPTENGNVIASYDPAKAKPIVVWEDLEGNRHAVTGGKRLAMAGASGAETVKAVVIREADGWTEGEARGLGATENLREGHGGIKNVVEAVDSLGADQVAELAGWHQANGSREFASTIRKGLAVAQKGGTELKAALAEGRIEEDFAYNVSQVLSMERVGEGWEAAQRELAALVGKVGPEEMDAVLWGLKRRLDGTDGASGGPEPLPKDGSTYDWAAAIAEERAKYNEKKGGKSGQLDSDAILMETEDGDLKTLGEMEAEQGNGELGTGNGEVSRVNAAEAPELAAAEGAGQNKAVALQPVAEKPGTFATLSHPNARFTVDGEKKVVHVEGLTEADFAAGNAEKTAALVARIEAYARENGLSIGFKDDAVMEAWRAAREQIKAEAAERFAAKDREARRVTVVDQLKKSGLAEGVVETAEDFNRMFEEMSGEALRAGEEVYGFVDPKTKKIYLNPEFFATGQGLEAPIHEFGHLGVIAAEKVNKAVYDRGMKLATDFLEKPESAGTGAIRELVDLITNDRVYSAQGRKVQAEELLAQLIGKRGAEALKAETNASVVAKVKSWLVEFWNTFGKALGLKDITPEQAENMTLEDVADAIRAEMFSGRKYGEGLDRVEFTNGGAHVVTKPVRIRKKLTGRRKAVNEFVNRMGGADDPANTETDLLALWVDNGGRLFDRMPFEVETSYSKGATGVKKTRRAVADEFSESTAFYRDLDPAQRKVFFGSEKLETGPIGEGLKNALEAAGITRFTREDGTVDYESVIDEFKRQWTNYERGEEVLKERNAWQEERDRAFVEEMERAEYEAVFGKDEPGATITPEEAAAQEAQIAADIAAGRFSRSGIFTGTAADYANRSRQGGVDHKWTDGQLRFSIGGQGGASNLGLKSAADAEQMEKDGASREDIWRTTGWWRGRDGKWRVEIPDVKRKRWDGDPEERHFTGGGEDFYRYRLTELIEDGDFQKAYPAARKIKVEFHKNMPANVGGNFNDATLTIKLPLKYHLTTDWAKEGLGEGKSAELNEAGRKTIVHELQHAIQLFESFAKGGSPTEPVRPYALDGETGHALSVFGEAVGLDPTNDRHLLNIAHWAQKITSDYTKGDVPQRIVESFEAAAKEAGKTPQEFRDEIERFYDSKTESPMGQYFKLEGEVEARNVQTRLGMTPEERAATPPWETEDVAEASQIVRFSRFAGEKGAENMGVGNANHARSMESAGADREKIWRETGWWKGKDGKWRFELPSARMKGEKELEAALLKGVNDLRDGSSETTLEKVMDAPELFKAYPQLKDTKIVFSPERDGKTGGWYDKDKNEIVILDSGLKTLKHLNKRDRNLYDTYQRVIASDEFNQLRLRNMDALEIKHGTAAEERENAKKWIAELDKRIQDENAATIRNLAKDRGRSSTFGKIVHEVQHAVQEIEGFAKGGNPELAAAFVKNLKRKQRIWLYKLTVEETARELGTTNPYEIEKAILRMLGASSREQVAGLEAEGWIPDKAGRDKGYNLFARGYDKEGYEEAYDKYLGEMNKSGMASWWNGSPHELYSRLAGEVEARNASRREEMTPEERAATPPWKTEDVPEDRQIVRFSRAKAVSDANGNESYKVESNGKTKRYKTPKEALEDFIKELDGQALNEEQQGIYDVVTGVKNTADIRKNDLGELVKFHKGGRGKGAGKIIAVHYAGKRGKVTAKEVIDIGQVIRSGTLDYDGTAEHPYSHTYTATASDGAELKVVIDLDKKGNEAVINFYSDRKIGNGGQRPHPVSTTTSSSPQSIPNSAAGAQGGGRSFNSVTPAEDAAYAEAVKRGDMETVRRMEREVYERMGYSDDSGYQGTSAFNGAAPSRNAYFETKAERIEATKRGEMEDTTTLGDFRDGIDLNNLQFIVFDPRSERNADAKRQEAIRNIRGVLDSGAKTIKMYRSVPDDVKEGQFRNGDWITPSRAYAEENARIHGWEKSRIIEQDVSIEDVWWDGNDIAEWGFDDGKGSVYKNTENSRKLLGPTYDDAGNLIPLSKRFNDRHASLLYSRAPEAKLVKTTRVADDAGQGEQTPGAIAASAELSRQPRSRIDEIGRMRVTSFPISEISRMLKDLSGNPMPVHVARRISGGRAAASSKDWQIYISSDVIGLVDRTDMAPLKDRLRQHGFFRYEDVAWCAAHSRAELRAERERSESVLGDELRKLAERRASGKEPGGQSAERIVLMNEFAKYVMNMPRKSGSLVGDVQTVGDAVRGALNVQLAAGGDRRTARETKMRDEAKALLSWAGWRVEDATKASVKDLTDTMFGAWLVIPDEMERVAPTWYDAILSTVTDTPNVAKAYRAAADRVYNSPQAYRYVLEEIQKSQSAAVKAMRDKLDAEAKATITARSPLRRFAEGLVLGYHDSMGLTWMRFDEETKLKLRARRKALAELNRKGATKEEIQAAAQEIDLLTGRIHQTKLKLELSRSAMERGVQNESLRYVIKKRLLADKAAKDWGLSVADWKLYLDQLWVVDSQGRSGSRGESAAQARLILGDMARRLGPEKWARMERFGREWFAIREQELLNDPRLERLVGKDIVDYWRSNAHYVTTKRVQSPEEMEAIERTREKMRKAGVNGGDDVCGEMFDYIGSGRGGREMLGEKLWKSRLVGSFADKADVDQATSEKDMKIQQAARVNQYIVDLRDALLMAEVPGVRDMPYGKADVKQGSRYGFLTYFDYGEKRTLVVPREIADGFRRDPDTFQWTAQMHRVARAMMIDYNLGYLPRNQMRNAGSIEKNMPGVYESWVKTLAGATGIPGAGPLVDLFLEHAARKSARTDRILDKVFFGITRFGHLNPADRAAKFIFDPEGWQQKFRDAEARGDEDAMRGLLEDKDFAMTALRGNMFTTLGNAYRDAVRHEELLKVGKAIGEAIERTPVARQVKKAADWLPRQNEFEDVFAKLVAFHHDRATWGKAHNRTVEESGLMVKQNVSIAEGERHGRNTRSIQTFFGQFFNMREKGVVRHLKAYRDRTKETLVKAGIAWSRRFVGTMFATGAIAAVIRWLYGDDDKKAEESPLGGIYRFAKFVRDASQNINPYASKNHQLVPVWLSPDGYTTITLGAALDDEDSLIAPSADFVARSISARMGLNPPPELGQTVLDTLWRGFAPDLDPSTPIVKTLRDTVYALADNPIDDFTGKPVYDPVLYAVRNESWSTRADFATAMAKRVWDDWGASAIYKFDRYGKESSDYGSASPWLGLALNNIPVVSSASRRFVKIHVREPGRGSGVDAAVSAEDSRRAKLRIYLSDKLLKKSEKMGGEMNRLNPTQYDELLADWQTTYGLGRYDMNLIEKRFLNKWSDMENRELVRSKKRSQLMRKSERIGIGEYERRMIMNDR